MDFYDIKDTETVSEGEYVFHTPSKTIVLCGTFSRSDDKIHALKDGKLLTDTISNFQKIEMPRADLYRSAGKHTRCGGCKGG